VPLHLPPYSPELNPVERFFKELRAQLANRIFDNLDARERVLIRALRHWRDKPQQLSQLTFYPWWRQGCQSIQTS
jgi:transposase